MSKLDKISIGITVDKSKPHGLKESSANSGFSEEPVDTDLSQYYLDKNYVRQTLLYRFYSKFGASGNQDRPISYSSEFIHSWTQDLLEKRLIERVECSTPDDGASTGEVVLMYKLFRDLRWHQLIMKIGEPAEKHWFVNTPSMPDYLITRS